MEASVVFPWIFLQMLNFQVEKADLEDITSD